MPSVTLPLLLLFPPFGQPPAEEGVESVEAAALTNRRAVRTASVAYRSRMEWFGEQPESRRVEAKVWMDGDRLRNDYVDDYPGLGEQAGRRYIECFNCERPGHHLTYPERPRFAGRLEPRPQGRFEPTVPTFDLRLLGYVAMPTCLLNHERLDSYIGRPDRADPKLAREVLDGIECRVVRYTIVDGKVRVAIWYDPNRGYHPVRIASVEGGFTDRDSFRRVLAVDLQPVGNGLWYPRSVLYTEHTGEKLGFREALEVIEVRVNQPIPAETFALKGMGIADGTHFSVVGTNEGSWVWRDGQLVTLESIEVKLAKQGLIRPPEQIPLVPPSRSRYWLYALAVGLVAAAAFFLRRAVRLRPA